MRALLTKCVVLVTVAMLAAAAPATAADGVAGLDFVEPDAAALSPDESGTVTKPLSLWLRNTSSSDATPTLTAQVEDTRGNPDSDLTVTEASGKPLPSIPAGQVVRMRIVVSGIQASSNLSGQLVASARGAAPATIDLTISPNPDFGGRGKWIHVPRPESFEGLAP